MRRILLVVGMLGGLLFLTPTAAIACSCAQADVAAYVKRADTVVDATVTWGSSNGVDRSYGVEVTDVFKGKAATEEKLRTAADEAACGLGEIAGDERYLFFIAGEHPGEMRVNLCGGSAPYTAALAQQVEAITGPPTGPYVAPPAKPGPKDDDQIQGTSVWTILGTGTVLVLVLGGLMYLRKKA